MSPYIRALTQAYVANAQSTLAIRSVCYEFMKL